MPESALLFPCGHTRALQQTVTVRAQRQLARDTYFLTFDAPDIARRILPGQFFMVRPAEGIDPLLGRPFALYDVVTDGGQAVGIEFGYVVVGRLTSAMRQWQPGNQAIVWGPLGNGFPAPQAEHLLLVAGGIGQTPFLAVAREALALRTYGERPAPTRPARRVTLCYGVRSAEYLAAVDEFEALGVDVRLATDDGTRGHHGFVTDLLAQSLREVDPPTRVYACGPEPMMHAAASICQNLGVQCWLSLESPMACGFGACFSCVTKVKVEGSTTDGDTWDYRRTCVEGPVFPASRLVL